MSDGRSDLSLYDELQEELRRRGQQPTGRQPASLVDEILARRRGGTSTQTPTTLLDELKASQGGARPAPSSSSEGPTRQEIEARARAVSSVSPESAEQAEEATKPTPPSFLSKLTGWLTAPSAFVSGAAMAGAKETSNPIELAKAGAANFMRAAQGQKADFYGDVLEETFPGGGTGAKWGKRVGGFLGDVVADPLNLVTLGTGTLGTAPAKAAGQAALKKAGTSGRLAPEVMETASELLGQGARSQAIRKITKQAPEAERLLRKEVPEVVGGVRLRVPFRTKTVPLIPGRVTSKVTGPIADPVNRFVAQPVRNALSYLPSQYKSAAGQVLAKGMREGEGIGQDLAVRGEDITRQAQRTFGGVDPDEARRVLETGVGASPEQTEAARGVREWLDEARRVQVEAGVDVPYRQDYLPREFTEDFLTAAGGDPVAGLPRRAAQPGHAKTRTLGDMTLDEAEEFLRAERGVGADVPVYVRDPVEALARHIERLPKRIQTQHAFRTMADEGKLKKGFGSFAGMDVDEVLRNYGSLSKAVRATEASLAEGLTPGLGKNLSRETVEGLAEQARLKGARAPLRYSEFPERVKTPPAGWARSDFAGGFVPTEVAEDLSKQVFGRQKVYGIPGTRAFKTLVTIPWPGFHSRNLYGSQSVNAARMPNYLGALMDSLRVARAGDDQVVKGFGKTGAELRDIMSREANLGGRSSLIGELAGRPGSAQDKFLRGAGTVTGGRKLMDVIETAARKPAFLRTLKETGDPDAARNFVSMLHGHYGELSPTARQLREVVPFAKWMTVNLPQQAGLAAQVPGRAMRPVKLFRNLEDPEARAQIEEEGYLSPQQAEREAFATEGGRVVSPDLPLFDLNQYLKPSGWPNLRSLFEGVHPAIKAAGDAVYDRTVGFGESRERGFTTARGPEVAIAGKLEKVPGLSRWVRRGKGGELFVSPKLKAALNMAPSSRLTSTIRALTDSDKGLAEQLPSLLGGVRIEQPSDFEVYRRDRELDALERELFRLGYGDDLRDAQSRHGVPGR